MPGSVSSYSTLGGTTGYTFRLSMSFLSKSRATCVNILLDTSGIFRCCSPKRDKKNYFYANKHLYISYCSTFFAIFASSAGVCLAGSDILYLRKESVISFIRKTKIAKISTDKDGTV